MAQTSPQFYTWFQVQSILPFAFAGAVANPAKPFVAIVGGSKVSTKITVVESLMEKAQKIIIGGGMIFTFFKARGLNVGTRFD